MSEGAEGHPYLMRRAQGRDELEAVLRFRYEHFFKCFAAGYPGLDHSRRRVFEPHDQASVHYCAFDAVGELCAVSSATPAGAKETPTEWGSWFRLGSLAHLGLNRVVVSTRMVLHPHHRHSGLFDAFYRFIIERYLDGGFACAVHYCSPGLVCRYEKLGHSLFGDPFVMPPGILRTPMLMDFNDIDGLRRVNSPIAGLCAARVPSFSGSLQTSSIGPVPPHAFRLLSPDERLDWLRRRTAADLPDLGEILPVLEHASLLLLRAGQSHAAPPSGGFLCFVLTGAIREQGTERVAGPGSFVGTSLLRFPKKNAPQFEVLVDSEVLAFDQNLTWSASRTGGDPEVQFPWRMLHLACGGFPSAHQARPGIQEPNPCGMRS